MNRSKITRIKLNGYELGRLVGNKPSVNIKMKHSCETTQDHVYIISSQDNGDNTFSEDITSILKEELLELAAKKYDIKNYISCKLNEEEGVIVFTYAISNDSNTGTRESSTPIESAGGGEQVKARPRIGRPKGTGKKLPVLPNNLHPGV